MQQQVCEVRPEDPSLPGPSAPGWLAHRLRLGRPGTLPRPSQMPASSVCCARSVAYPITGPKSGRPRRGGSCREAGAGRARRSWGWAEPRRREGPLTGAGLPGGLWVTCRGVSCCRASPERSAGAPGIPRATGTPFALWRRRFRAGSQRRRRCGMSCPQQHRRSREPAEGGRCPAGVERRQMEKQLRGLGWGGPPLLNSQNDSRWGPQPSSLHPRLVLPGMTAFL